MPIGITSQHWPYRSGSMWRLPSLTLFCTSRYNLLLIDTPLTFHPQPPLRTAESSTTSSAQLIRPTLLPGPRAACFKTMVASLPARSLPGCRYSPDPRQRRKFCGLIIGVYTTSRFWAHHTKVRMWPIPLILTESGRCVKRTYTFLVRQLRINSRAVSLLGA